MTFEEYYKKELDMSEIGVEITQELYGILKEVYNDGQNNVKRWHDLKKNPNDLPTTDDDKLYLVYVYSNSPEKFRFGEYTPVVCFWNYDFWRFDILESTIGASAVNTKNILKWRELESC